MVCFLTFLMTGHLVLDKEIAKQYVAERYRDGYDDAEFVAEKIKEGAESPTTHDIWDMSKTKTGTFRESYSRWRPRCNEE